MKRHSPVGASRPGGRCVAARHEPGKADRPPVHLPSVLRSLDARPGRRAFHPCGRLVRTSRCRRLPGARPRRGLPRKPAASAPRGRLDVPDGRSRPRARPSGWTVSSWQAAWTATSTPSTRPRARSGGASRRAGRLTVRPPTCRGRSSSRAATGTCTPWTRKPAWNGGGSRSGRSSRSAGAGTSTSPGRPWTAARLYVGSGRRLCPGRGRRGRKDPLALPDRGPGPLLAGGRRRGRVRGQLRRPSLRARRRAGHAPMEVRDAGRDDRFREGGLRPALDPELAGRHPRPGRRRLPGRLPVRRRPALGEGALEDRPPDQLGRGLSGDLGRALDRRVLRWAVRPCGGPGDGEGGLADAHRLQRPLVAGGGRGRRHDRRRRGERAGARPCDGPGAVARRDGGGRALLPPGAGRSGSTSGATTGSSTR